MHIDSRIRALEKLVASCTEQVTAWHLSLTVFIIIYKRTYVPTPDHFEPTDQLDAAYH